MGSELSTRGRFAALLARITGAIRGLVDRVRARRLRLRAEVRIVEGEVRRLGARIWERIDALRLTAHRFEFTPIRTQFYGHGAFMGAAPALLADPRWRRILGFLMPDVFEQLWEAIESGAGPSRLMSMLENNPVLAAFGVSRSAEGIDGGDAANPNHMAGLEWDVFVDSALIERWEAATDADAKRRCILRALDTSLIAHANSADTVQEAMGIAQYADVRRTPKTELGGVELDSWLDLFGRALSLAHAVDMDAAVDEMSQDPRATSDEECMRNTFAKPWSIPRVVEVHRAVTGKPFISIILEIKSLRSTAPFLADLVRELNARGVHVAAVASFLRDEVRGVSAHRQHVAGHDLDGPREIQFFHFVGDLQHACRSGEIEAGQSVLFNGASLLEVAPREGSSGGLPRYIARQRVLDEFEALRARYGLHVGVYVQEGDCDGAAAGCLAELVERRPETFELGFAWGGIRDQAHLPVTDEVRLGYGSQRMLEYVGRARQWDHDEA